VTTAGPALRDYWYIAAESRQLGRRPLARTLFGEPLVLFRDGAGRPAALLDRCAHRNMALSAGRVVDGCVECPYHGWRYDAAGRCTAIPARCAGSPAIRVPGPRAYPAVEQDGYVWVCPGGGAPATPPFRFPHLGEPGWTSFRMANRFPASAFACLENFLDCPHTVFVHRGWFRRRDPRPLQAEVRRFRDRVEAVFHDEPQARSLVSALFFPRDVPLAHTDRFHLPTISRVDYAFGAARHFVITSQCTPVAEDETAVYTVVTFRVGRLGPLVRLLLEPVCRRIIAQDVRILALQTAQLRRFGGPRFTTVPTDLFARHIRALWAQVERAGIPDPSAWDRDVPERKDTVPIRF
jgi:phenylpropionate dioxygenase-like ring-hydroxylating dioxygenase large terminal subunit